MSTQELPAGKIKIEGRCSDSTRPHVVDASSAAAKTGQIGDGKISFS